ncbi:MSHA biogenesis protein MshA [Aeromonas hydrophila]|uniref:Prepilin-type N-terminal cleavage/methylation domain-containing protein n=1 Tax=Aeromonas hydrophila TaxID=644 RepID=A0AAX3P4I6_AERHY|nr:prepilin-type N-terminal cleavage/methylation domain-containing protein [Aeromonas hydrophila]GKQ63193.1 MSHA pilin protein MshA [Aeromonas caviae]HDT5863885.1 prepilin-type N-terminal cleavage/methylation domain-containing protein [Aeromonas hydrophila subsp. hydrophila]KHE17006.1 MSHA biogenesis protein MshA [Aeromonas hydrophila]MCO4115319.1 prepilin-type N-terminal cleavage/methylation domain-containing protein [Aeromonas hydrophila]MCV9383831.1 prepilin-type N-terminal cleavage/methyla
MKKQAGFTLIELVIVIIILGILAVTAAPKFLNLQDDARTSTLKGVAGSLNSAGAMVYSKSVLKGKDKESTAYTLDLGNGKTVSTLFGYPVATSAALSTVVELNSAEWAFAAPTGSNPAAIKIFPNGVSTTSTTCFVTYTEATSTSVPTAVTTDCN